MSQFSQTVSGCVQSSLHPNRFLVKCLFSFTTISLLFAGTVSASHFLLTQSSSLSVSATGQKWIAVDPHQSPLTPRPVFRKAQEHIVETADLRGIGRIYSV